MCSVWFRILVVYFLIAVGCIESKTETVFFSDEDADDPINRTLGVMDNVRSVAVGMRDSCAVTKDGELWCWGNNNYGQIGNGTKVASWTPQRVEGILEPVAKVRVGTRHTCAVTESNSLYCFGNNYYWALGIDNDCYNSDDDCIFLTPQLITSVGNNVEDVALGSSHTCVLNTEGEVRCFGDNEYGTLGNGTIGYETSTAEPSPVHNMPERVTALTAGVNHTCAALESGGVKCWGDNSSGQLGRGHSSNFDSNSDISIPEYVINLHEKVVHMDANWWHTCAVTETSETVCWGDSLWGAVGVVGGEWEGGVEEGIPFRPTVPLDNIVQVSTGETFSCALNKSGSVVCWSVDEGLGILGPAIANGSIYHEVPLESPGTYIGSGTAHSCVSTADGRVFCWGDNEHGELGDGSGGYVMTADIPGKNIVAVDTGGLYNCAIDNNARAICWATETYFESPIIIEDIIDITSDISQLSGLVCAVTVNGKLLCFGEITEYLWAENKHYQWKHELPTQIEGLPDNLRSVTTTDYGALVLTEKGEVFYWGYLIGEGFGVRAFSGIPTVQQVDRYIALTKDGRLLQLDPNTGEGAETDFLKTFAAAAGEIVSISASGYSTPIHKYCGICAVNINGEVWCASTSSSSSESPQKMQLPSPIEKVSIGINTCMINNAGEAWCYGCDLLNYTEEGPCRVVISIPTTVTGLTDLVDISTGGRQSCAVKTSGEVVCWGQHGPGLGVKDITGYSSMPVAIQSDR